MVDLSSAASHRSSRAVCARFVLVAFGIFVLISTASASSVTFSCDASAPPENGGVGDCTAALPEGDSCTPTCDEGFASSRRRRTGYTPERVGRERRGVTWERSIDLRVARRARMRVDCI